MSWDFKEAERLRPFESLGPCGAHGEAARREFVCSGPRDHLWHDERCRGFRVWKDNGRPLSAPNPPESPDSSQAAPKGGGVDSPCP